MCRMVPVPRWHYDEMGLAWYAGFYMPVPLKEGETDPSAIPVTKNYISAMNKLKEASDI